MRLKKTGRFTLLLETDSQYHNDLIIDQFTKQAIPFTQNAAHSAEYAIKRLVTLSNVSKNDTVLDVACGSGLVSCGYLKVSPIYVSTTTNQGR